MRRGDPKHVRWVLVSSGSASTLKEKKELRLVPIDLGEVVNNSAHRSLPRPSRVVGSEGDDAV
jgi:hypothetical protein